MKVAGAPISWGVSELPAWGYQMSPDRVLAEMKEAGLEATELGPPGYLPEDPAARLDLLDRYGLRLVGGFLAAVLHERHRAPLEEIEREARALEASGAEVLVLAAALPGESYDRDERLSPPDWVRLAETLAAAEDVASAHRLHLAFHPHVGTAVARKEDIDTVLETTSVDICLDTGHLFLGGADPLAIARDAPGRVSHVHLKDVDAEVADRIRSGRLSYAEGVRAGLYRPLGQGDLDIESVFTRLQDAGYRGWYVLEQDTALTAEPEPARGPVAAAQQSLEYFRRIAGAKQHTALSKED
jgi:inosose dehydratase